MKAIIGLDMKLRSEMIRINIVKNRNGRIITVSYIFIIFLYPFVTNLYNLQSELETINRFMFFFVIFLLALKNRTRSKGNQILKMAVFFLLMYLSASLICSSLLYSFSFNTVFKESFYVIIPLLIFYIALKYPINSLDRIKKIIIYATLISTVIGFVLLIDDNAPFFSLFSDVNSRYKLSAVYGQIVNSYMEQLSFSILLFKQKKRPSHYVLMLVFLLATLLTGQRAGVIGLVIAVVIYVLVNYGNIGKSNRTKRFFKLIVAGLVCLIIFITLNEIGIMKFDLFERLDQILYHKFSWEKIGVRADNQMVITEKNVITAIIGEGLGKYSHNNPNASLVQSDACYYRIFNELGLIGFILFFIPIIISIKNSIKSKDAFMIYFFIEITFVFFFNRIIWTVPINFVFYTFMAYAANKNIRVKKQQHKL